MNEWEQAWAKGGPAAVKRYWEQCKSDGVVVGDPNEWPESPYVYVLNPKHVRLVRQDVPAIKFPPKLIRRKSGILVKKSNE